MTPSLHQNSATAAQIQQHLAACDASFHPTLTSRVDLADYAAKLARHATRFEAWSEGHLIGLVAVYCNAADRDTAFVSSVSVDPAHRGQGTARLLMRACIAHLRALTFQRLTLEVDPAALPAVRLYGALGFRPDGVVPRRMTLDLTAPTPAA